MYREDVWYDANKGGWFYSYTDEIGQVLVIGPFKTETEAFQHRFNACGR